MYTFEGICLAVRRKFLKDLNSAIVLRNSISGVCIECIFSYYYNRIYNVEINDYKRKFDKQRKSKLYFLRRLSNAEIKV